MALNGISIGVDWTVTNVSSFVYVRLSNFCALIAYFPHFYKKSALELIIIIIREIQMLLTHRESSIFLEKVSFKCPVKGTVENAPLLVGANRDVMWYIKCKQYWVHPILPSLKEYLWTI